MTKVTKVTEVKEEVARMADRRLSVFAASSFIDEVNAEWDAAFAVTRSIESSTPLLELRRLAGEGVAFDVLLLSLDVKLGAKEIAALPETIRAVATYSVGTDHIDLEAARRAGLVVFNTPGVLGDSVAENAIFLMLGAARRATESIELLRSRAWKGWTPTQLVGLQLGGRVLGILGMGDIGLRIARRARALGMSIHYTNRKPLPSDRAADATYHARPEALVEACDVLMIVCPSTRQTRGMVDEDLLSHASPDLLVVNVARGDIVVDDALIAALGSGRIRGAGLDVFAGEPDIDPRYFDLPNVFMLPHIGSSTLEARLGMGRILIEALRDWSAGGSPSNQVV